MSRQPSPHAEQLAVALTTLVEAQLAGRDDEVTAVLARIGQPVADVERRADVPLSRAVAIYRRDCWTCRYCGMRTIPIPVLRVLSALHPEQLPHHPNWKAGQVHPAYLLVSTSLDHLVPGARGGHWTDEGNLVCACWVCNCGKADFALAELGWQVLDPAAVASDWEGLTGRYAELWRAAGEPEPATTAAGCARLPADPPQLHVPQHIRHPGGERAPASIAAWLPPTATDPLLLLVLSGTGHAPASRPIGPLW